MTIATNEGTFEENVRVWVCPKCAFAFDACHGDAEADTYSCPVCEETSLAAERDRLREVKDVYEALVLAVQEYLGFTPSTIGMPHMGSEAWQDSRDRVMRLVDPAWTVATENKTEGG